MTMAAMIEYMIATIQVYPSDKEFDIDAYDLLHWTRISALVLAGYFLREGRDKESVYMLFHVAITEEMKERGPDKTLKVLEHMRKFPENLNIHFITLWHISKKTSTRADILKYFNEKRLPHDADHPLRKLLLPPLRHCDQSTSPIHSFPDVIDEYEERVKNHSKKWNSYMFDITVFNEDDQRELKESPYNDTTLGRGTFTSLQDFQVQF